MPAKNPRVMVVLDPAVNKWVRDKAKSDGTSVSLKVRDILREAYETYEDVALDIFAAERERTYNRKKALTTDEARARLGLKKR